MKEIIKRTVRNSGFEDTIKALWFDLARAKARARSNKMLKRRLNEGPLPTNLHFGCGGRKVNGWLNCDLSSTDVDVDLGSGKLPFRSDTFEAALSQHVIEHLSIHRELKPLLKELIPAARPATASHCD